MSVLAGARDLCFTQNNKKYHNFHLKIFIFAAMGGSIVLNRHVFVLGVQKAPERASGRCPGDAVQMRRLARSFAALRDDMYTLSA